MPGLGFSKQLKDENFPISVSADTMHEIDARQQLDKFQCTPMRNRVSKPILNLSE